MNPQETQPQDTPNQPEDTVVFLAKQVIKIRDELSAKIEELSKGQAENKKSVDEIKTMLKEALND